MLEPLPREGSWRARVRPRRRWQRTFVRTLATACVTSPDGTSYRVVAHRIVWPRGGGVDTDTVLDLIQLPSVLASRIVWAVRVTIERPRRPRQLVYGEELRYPDDAVRRAREIADSLIATGEF